MAYERTFCEDSWISSIVKGEATTRLKMARAGDVSIGGQTGAAMELINGRNDVTDER